MEADGKSKKSYDVVLGSNTETCRSGIAVSEPLHMQKPVDVQNSGVSHERVLLQFGTGSTVRPERLPLRTVIHEAVGKLHSKGASYSNRIYPMSGPTGSAVVKDGALTRKPCLGTCRI